MITWMCPRLSEKQALHRCFNDEMVYADLLEVDFASFYLLGLEIVSDAWREAIDIARKR